MAERTDEDRRVSREAPGFFVQIAACRAAVGPFASRRAAPREAAARYGATALKASSPRSTVLA